MPTDDRVNYYPSSYGIDYWLLTATGALLAIGVLMVFSTTAVVSANMHGSTTALLQQHVIHVLLGIVACIVCSQLPPHVFLKFGRLALIVAIVLIVLVLIPGVGYAAGGARRWISLGPVMFQPGECAKLLLLIYMSSYIGRHASYMPYFVPGALYPCMVLGVFAVCLLAEPDFGSTVVVSVVVYCQLSLVTRLRNLAILGGLGAAGAACAIMMSPYRWQRMQVFMDPFADPSQSGYQLIQSLIAVGSGGLWGTGLGSGEQKLFYLPAAHTDFIFAMIAEELGLFGAVAVIGLFWVIAVRGLIIAQRLQNDAFCCSLAVGCTVLIVVPAFFNIAVVLGMLPTKGMVLPFIAYGGTGLIVYLATMGILMNLSRIDARDLY